MSRLIRLGNGTVAHAIGADGMTLCRRIGTAGTAVMAGMKLCKPCSVVTERQARQVAADSAPKATRLPSLQVLRAEVEARRADHKRIVGRLNADIAIESFDADYNVSTVYDTETFTSSVVDSSVTLPNGKTVDIRSSVSERIADALEAFSAADLVPDQRVKRLESRDVEWVTRRATTDGMADHASSVQVLNGAILHVLPFGRGTETSLLAGSNHAFRIPLSHAYADAWQYVAEQTRDQLTMARVIYRLSLTAHANGWRAQLTDQDDALQLVRLNLAARLLEWSTRADATRHAADCSCVHCTHGDGCDCKACQTGIDPWPMSAPLGDGTVAYSAPRFSRCTLCVSCLESVGAHKWNVDNCSAPIESVYYAPLGAIAANILKATCQEFVRSNGRKRENIGDVPESVTRESDALEYVPTALAAHISAIAATCLLTGDDVTVKSGGLSQAAGSVAAMMTRHVTVGADGSMDAPSSAQRKAALQDLRAMAPKATAGTEPDILTCRCIRTFGRVTRRCVAHGGNGLIRWASIDARRLIDAADGSSRFHSGHSTDGGRATGHVSKAWAGCNHASCLSGSLPRCTDGALVTVSPVSGLELPADAVLIYTD